MIRILLIVLLSIVSLSNASPPHNRVVGGEDANHGQFSFIVSLRSQSGSHFCGGSLIKADWVLTAAHCVLSRSASEITVVAGTIERNGKGVSAAVKEVIVHSNYNPVWILNDIALLQLTTGFQVSNSITTIKLSEDNRDLAKNCTLVGWGRISYPEGLLPESLQFLPLRSIIHSDCKQKLSQINIVQENQICTLTIKGEGACHGDSGGPLFEETENGREVIGIVSWGSPCANGYPDVFTKVASFNEWIQRYVK